jgi:hypothetical protein
MTPTEIILIIVAVITCILAIGSTILAIREWIKNKNIKRW